MFSFPHLLSHNPAFSAYKQSLTLIQYITGGIAVVNSFREEACH